MPAAESTMELRAVLAAIGATPATVATLLDGLDNATLRAAEPGGRSCLAVVEDFIQASQRLGKVAHDVLGHVPPPKDPAHTAEPPPIDGLALQTQLRFLREHIVSTVDQQGAAVWSVPSPAGRPLFAYAVDLMHEDETLLVDLRQVVAAAHAGDA